MLMMMGVLVTVLSVSCSESSPIFLCTLKIALNIPLQADSTNKLWFEEPYSFPEAATTRTTD